MNIFKRFHYLILATSTLIGTIVGVGMFGLPFVAVKAGIIPVIFYLLVLGGVVMILNLIYGEVVLRTRKQYRLVGYAEHYLGKLGKIFAGFSLFLGLYGALLAYSVLGGEFLSFLLGGLFSPFIASLLLMAVGFYVVHRGLKTIGIFEVFMTAILLSLILGLLSYGSQFISFENLVLWGDVSFLFLPYGVVLFSLWGLSAVPEIRGFFVEKPKRLRKAIIIGTLIPIFLYLIFVITIVGISGANTTVDSISGLVSSLGSLFSKYGALVGFLAVTTSFFTLAIIMRDSLHLDFKIPSLGAIILTFLVPLVLFLLGARNFITIVSWVGAITGSIEGIVVLLLQKKARVKNERLPEYTINIKRSVRYGLYLLFVVAILYQILNV